MLLSPTAICVMLRHTVLFILFRANGFSKQRQLAYHAIHFAWCFEIKCQMSSSEQNKQRLLGPVWLRICPNLLVYNYQYIIYLTPLVFGKLQLLAVEYWVLSTSSYPIQKTSVRVVVCWKLNSPLEVGWHTGSQILGLSSGVFEGSLKDLAWVARHKNWMLL